MNSGNLIKTAMILSAAPFALFGAACSAVDTSMGSGGEYTAELLGTNEVPNPGDPSATGMATVRVNSDTNQVCYELTVHDLDDAMAAHIHAGEAGANGAPVVTLETPSGGGSTGCVDVSPATIGEILGNPSGYYVNVHNPEFRGGAIRGQLG